VFYSPERAGLYLRDRLEEVTSKGVEGKEQFQGPHRFFIFLKIILGAKTCARKKSPSKRYAMAQRLSSPFEIRRVVFTV
jgi:hypothetical protein